MVIWLSSAQIAESTQTEETYWNRTETTLTDGSESGSRSLARVHLGVFRIIWKNELLFTLNERHVSSLNTPKMCVLRIKLTES